MSQEDKDKLYAAGATFAWGLAFAGTYVLVRQGMIVLADKILSK